MVQPDTLMSYAWVGFDKILLIKGLAVSPCESLCYTAALHLGSAVLGI